MRQVEVSRTLTFDAHDGPGRFLRRWCQTTSASVALRRSSAIFTGRRTPLGRPRTQPEIHKTKIITRGSKAGVNAFWKHSRIKQYLKDGRALRIQTVINSGDDLGVGRRLHNLPQLQAKLVPPTVASSMFNVPARALPPDRYVRADPTALHKGRCDEPEPCASGILAPWPWPVLCV